MDALAEEADLGVDLVAPPLLLEQCVALAVGEFRPLGLGRQRLGAGRLRLPERRNRAVGQEASAATCTTTITAWITTRGKSEPSGNTA